MIHQRDPMDGQLVNIDGNGNRIAVGDRPAMSTHRRNNNVAPISIPRSSGHAIMPRRRTICAEAVAHLHEDREVRGLSRAGLHLQSDPGDTPQQRRAGTDPGHPDRGDARLLNEKTRRDKRRMTGGEYDEYCLP
jgi:hypothetical protein